MKDFLNVIKLMLTGVLVFACTTNDWEEISHIRDGFAAFSDSSRYEVRLVMDPALDTIIYEVVDIHLEFIFYSKITVLEKMGIMKTLCDESGNRLHSAEILVSESFRDTLAMDITGMEALFVGLDFSPDSIRNGYYFEFSSFLVPEPGVTITSAYGNYLVEPEYVNFCNLPDFPLGTYEAFNKSTGYKKDIEVRYIEVMPGVWFYVFTDFGLDWSTWNDFWYGTNFYMDCPLPGMSYYTVNLAGWGIDLPQVTLEMENDEGVPETRPLRVMPWVISTDSPGTGCYDAVNRQFIFKNVHVVDSWWGIDNYLIEEITFTYKGGTGKSAN